MSYGLEIKNSSGQIKYDSESQTIRAISSVFIPDNSSSSETVSDYDSNFGFITITVTGSNSELSYFFDNSSKLFSWSNPNNNPALAYFFSVK